jgi:hypothetical protein
LNTIYAPTQAAPSEEAIMLEVVDVSKAPVTLPVHGRLLIRACEKDDYDRCHSNHEPPWCENTYECEIGFLDSENNRLLRLYSFIENPGWPEYGATLAWSPDGTQLVYFRGGFNSGSFTILHADGSTELSLGKSYNSYASWSPNGSTELSLGEFYNSYAFWSPDGHYLVVKTSTGSHTEPTSGYTVYDAGSWQEICRVASCQNCNIPASTIGLGERCELSVGDGHTLVLSGFWGQAEVSIVLCDSQESCVYYPDKEDAINNWSYREQTQQKYYLVKIENYWLRLIDIMTGIERAYVIPNYRITNVTWTPD